MKPAAYRLPHPPSFKPEEAYPFQQTDASSNPRSPMNVGADTFPLPASASGGSYASNPPATSTAFSPPRTHAPPQFLAPMAPSNPMGQVRSGAETQQPNPDVRFLAEGSRVPSRDSAPVQAFPQTNPSAGAAANQRQGGMDSAPQGMSSQAPSTPATGARNTATTYATGAKDAAVGGMSAATAMARQAAERTAATTQTAASAAIGSTMGAAKMVGTAGGMARQAAEKTAATAQSMTGAAIGSTLGAANMVGSAAGAVKDTTGQVVGLAAQGAQTIAGAAAATTEFAYEVVKVPVNLAGDAASLAVHTSGGLMRQVLLSPFW